MPVTFPSYDAFKYVQVWTIVAMKDGAIYKTKHKGYALATRPMQEGETYSSLSTSMMQPGQIVTLELLD